MQLLTDEARAHLPPLRSQEEVADPIVHLKFFTPDSSWTWYVTEGEPEADDFYFFGFVIGVEPEWGPFLLSELESIRGALELPIERDLFFTRGPIREVLAREGHRGQLL